MAVALNSERTGLSGEAFQPQSHRLPQLDPDTVASDRRRADALSNMSVRTVTVIAFNL